MAPVSDVFLATPELTLTCSCRVVRLDWLKLLKLHDALIAITQFARCPGLLWVQ